MDKILHYASLLSIMAILLISLIPTKEYSWGYEDCILAMAVPTVTFIATLTMMIKHTEFHIRAIDIILTLWYIYYTAYAYIYPQYPASQSVLRLTFLLAIFFSLSCILLHYKHNTETISTLIIAICLVEGFIGVFQLVYGLSRNNLYTMTGTLLNPGPYGILLSCGLILFIDKIRKHKTASFNHVCIRSMIIVLFSYMIMATGSRTAITAILVCLAYMFRHQMKEHTRTIFPCLLAGVCLLYFCKQDSANGRIAMYFISLYNITQRPLFGSGIGSFLHQHAVGTEDLSYIMPTSFFFANDIITKPFNLPLYIGVEQGSAGILFLFSFIAVTIRALKRNSENIKYIIPLLAVSSLFSYTFEILPFQIFAVYSLAVVFLNDKPVIVSNRKVMAFLFSFFFIATISTLLFIRPRVKTNIEYTKNKGICTEHYTSKYRDLLPFMNDNPCFLFDFAKMLSAQNRLNDSNSILRIGQNISADPMFHILQANNYVKLHEYATAEQHYKKAYDIMPNRIYPLYKLMNLYIKSRQKGKAILTAERIVNFRVKIESTATKQMQQEAKDYLRHSRCQ